MPKRADDGRLLTIRPAGPPYRTTSKPRWTRIHGPRHFSKLSTGPTDMPSSGGFRRQKRRRPALGRSSSLLECSKGKRRFILDLTSLLDLHFASAVLQSGP